MDFLNFRSCTPSTPNQEVMHKLVSPKLCQKTDIGSRRDISSQDPILTPTHIQERRERQREAGTRDMKKMQFAALQGCVSTSIIIYGTHASQSCINLSHKSNGRSLKHRAGFGTINTLSCLFSLLLRVFLARFTLTALQGSN